MQTKVGKNRLVFVFPRLGLAVKFPMIHLVRATQQLFTYGWQRLPYPGDVYKSLTEHLFKGMGDNLREWRFYLQTRHPFCQPTYFSFFGLVNLQRAAVTCQMPIEEFWSQMHRVTGSEAFTDAHHFANPANFCHDQNKRLMIVDYGHLKTQKIVRKLGTSLHACHHRTCV